MAYMVEITESKFDKACEHVEQALKSMGKVMQCFTEWEEESSMGHREGSYGSRSGYGSRSMMGQRGDYGSRGGYGNRNYMGYRDEEEWEDYEEIGERRGVRGSGRGRR